MAGKRYLSAVIATAAIGLLAACGSSDDESSSESADTVKIGVLTALSGDFVPFGQPLADGVRLAVEEVNANGGLEIDGKSYDVEIVEKDTRSDVNTAVAGATELVRDDKVKFVVGAATGIETGAVKEITQPAGAIELSAASDLQSVLTPENTRPGAQYQHLFMVQAGSDVRERLMVEAVMKDFGKPQRHAIIISKDSNGEFISARIAEEIKRAGGELVMDPVMYEPGTTDFSPFLTRIKAQRPDVVHIWWLPTDGANILEQAQELDVAPQYYVFGLEPADIRSKLGNSVKDVITGCSPICQSEITTPAIDDFWKRYAKLIGGEKEFGSAAGGAAWYYDGTQLLFEAMKEAGSVDDTDAIAAKLASAQYDGVLGDVSFDDRHVMVHGFDVCLMDGAKAECEYAQPD